MARLEDVLRPIETRPQPWLRSQGAFWLPLDNCCDAAHAILGHNIGHLTEQSYCEDRSIPVVCSSKFADSVTLDCSSTGQKIVAS